MADDEFIEIHVDEDEVMRGFDLQEQWAKHMLHDLLDNLADKGLEVLRMHAPSPGAGHPESSGGIQERIDRSEVHWQPSATGGEYEVIVGVKAGHGRYPIYVNEGTGIYSYTGGYIKSLGRGHLGLMWFYSNRYGHVIGIREVAGQRPQRFLYETWRDLAIYTEWRLIGEAALFGI